MKNKATIICTIIGYCLLAIPHLFADLWMDELLSLWDYWCLPSITDVLQTYPIPNNHIFFSVVMWIWCRLCPDAVFWEPLLRLPCLGIALGTVAVILWGTRRRWRHCWFLAALPLIFSPICLPFSLQLRGYGLTLFLATMATFGALDIAGKDYRRGLALFLPGIVLLPGVMPGNFLLSGSLVLFLAWHSIWQRLWRQEIRLFMVLAGSLSFSALPYLWIWPQTLQVAGVARTLGWRSSPAVFGNLMLAVAAHLAVPLIVALVMLLADRNLSVRCLGRRPAVLAAVVGLLVIIAVLICRWPAPYPRVFLAFFPLFTFALADIIDHWQTRSIKLHTLISKPLVLWLAFFLANYGLWTTVTNATAAAEMRHGRYPQNLLEQFYRGSHHASQAVHQALQRPDASCLVVIADFHQALPFRYYWYAAGNDPARVINHHRQHRQVQAILHYGDRRHILVLASGIDQARSLLNGASNRNKLTLCPVAGSGIYRLFAINSP